MQHMKNVESVNVMGARVAANPGDRIRPFAQERSEAPLVVEDIASDHQSASPEQPACRLELLGDRIAALQAKLNKNERPQSRGRTRRNLEADALQQRYVKICEARLVKHVHIKPVHGAVMGIAVNPSTAVHPRLPQPPSRTAPDSPMPSRPASRSQQRQSRPASRPASRAQQRQQVQGQPQERREGGDASSDAASATRIASLQQALADTEARQRAASRRALSAEARTVALQAELRGQAVAAEAERKRAVELEARLEQQQRGEGARAEASPHAVGVRGMLARQQVEQANEQKQLAMAGVIQLRAMAAADKPPRRWLRSLRRRRSAAGAGALPHGRAVCARALERYDAFSELECSVRMFERIFVHLDVAVPSGYLAVRLAGAGAGSGSGLRLGLGSGLGAGAAPGQGSSDASGHASGLLPRDVLLVCEGLTARMLATFEAECDGELSADEGAHVTLLQPPPWLGAEAGAEPPQGWSLVMLGGANDGGEKGRSTAECHMRFGYVPEAFLEHREGAPATPRRWRQWKVRWSMR